MKTGRWGMMPNGIVGAIALALASTTVGAAEYFVDAKNGRDGSGRGTTEATAFLSIQAAVDAAAAGDTITLLPGDYTEGLTADATYGRSRVVIGKKLTLRSKNGRASRDTTRIVGAWDTTESSSYPYGMGPNRIRCVCVLSSGAGSTFEGITFYRGAASHDGTNDHGGGGIFVANNKGVTAIDCAFRECQARNGGGMCSMSTGAGCVAVRCLFKRNRTYKFASGFRGGSCYNCVFDDNDYTRDANGNPMTDKAATASGATDYSAAMINCTYVGSANKGAGGYDHTIGVYNCTFVYCYNGAMGVAADKYGHCVSHDDSRTNNASATAYVDRCELFSPYDEDYRLIQDAKSLTTGSLDELEKIPAEYRDTDYYGNPRVTGGVVYCGAVQGKLDGPASGFYITRDPTVGQWFKDGEPMAMNYRTIMQKEGYRNAFDVKFVPTNGLALLRYKLGDNPFWPMPDDSVWAVNPNWGGVKALQCVTCKSAYWVDGAAETEDADGSETKPFPTIQAAVDAVVAAKCDAIVRVRKGDYATGERELLDLKSRVAIPAEYAKILRIVAVDGADRTFITGAADPTGSAETWGLGAGAVRCVAAACSNAVVAIHGFTLRGGRSANSGDNSASRGGAFAARNSAGGTIPNIMLVDCFVTNCAAKYGSAVYGGTMYRCRATDCLVMDGMLRSAAAYSSLFTKASRYNGSSRAIGNWASLYNCTVAENGAVGVSTSVTTVRNSVLGWNGLTGNNGCDIENTMDTTKVSYTLYQKANSTMAASNVKEYPVLFADTSKGDFTLLGTSKGMARAYVKNQYYPILDVNGKPYDIGDDGTCVAGAFRTAALSDKTFYVDAVGGNDENDGLSEATAVRTLARAMRDVAGGDTVIALPGTYAEGTMLQAPGEAVGRNSCMNSAEGVLPSRVVVKAGVSLVSRDGAEATIIEGASNTRCVFLGKNATLRGFTVQHGDLPAVSKDGLAQTPDTSGAGVLCFAGAAVTEEEFLGLVENCIIRDNRARLGAGGTFGTYRNCRFIGNDLKLHKPGVAARYCSLEGCLFEGNGPGNHSTIYCCDTRNCTVLAGQSETSGTVMMEGSYDRVTDNTLIMGEKIALKRYRNCVFGNPKIKNARDAEVKEAVNCLTGEVALAENGSLLKGSLAIDAGANEFLPDGLEAAGDLADGQRVMNARVDAGAYEYDWRGDYSKALAKRRLAVTDVPGEAVLAGQVLTWTDGRILIDWTSGGYDAPYAFTIKVAEGGALTVTLNGETLGTYGAGTQVVRFNSAAELNALAFVAKGEASISAFEHRSGALILLR